MQSMKKDTILKELEMIYRHALKNNQLNIALQAAEQQAYHMGLFEKQQSLPPQRLPEVMRIEDMTEEQLRDFIAALEKLDPSLKELDAEVKHPPPLTHA